MRARLLVALSLLLLAGLSWLADARPLPLVAPADAAEWEGQAVRVAGWASDVRQGDGGVRFVLRQGRDALHATLAAGGVHDGDWVEAEGRLARLGGRLLLLADRARAAPGPGPLTPSWADLAEAPGAWTGVPLRLSGFLADGALVGPAGQRLALGSGPWPADGPAEVEGRLAYAPACLCHRLEAAWTP